VSGTHCCGRAAFGAAALGLRSPGLRSPGLRSPGLRSRGLRLQTESLETSPQSAIAWEPETIWRAALGADGSLIIADGMNQIRLWRVDETN
jgi:hypothetical protein